MKYEDNEGNWEVFDWDGEGELPADARVAVLPQGLKVAMDAAGRRYALHKDNDDPYGQAMASLDILIFLSYARVMGWDIGWDEVQS